MAGQEGRFDLFLPHGLSTRHGLLTGRAAGPMALGGVARGPAGPPGEPIPTGVGLGTPEPPAKEELPQAMQGSEGIGSTGLPAADEFPDIFSSSVGMRIGVSSPARERPTSFCASRLSVLIRWPGCRGMRLGAMTSQGRPQATSCRWGP